MNYFPETDDEEVSGGKALVAKDAQDILEHLSEFHITNEVLVYSTEEVEYWQDSVNHVIASALNEGRVVYARS